jgi:hypothetical protein
MKRFNYLIAAALLAGFPSVASAQQAAPTPNAQETLTFVDANAAGPGLYGNPYASGPYTGRFNAPSPTYSFSLYCVDYLHTVNNGETYLVDATGLDSDNTGSGLGNTMQGANATSWMKYTRAAYLSSLFGSWSNYLTTSLPGATTNYGTADVANRSDVWSALHVAIWNIVNPVPGAEGLAGNDGLRTYFENLSQTAVDNGWTAEGWYVLTDAADPARRQEFLVNTTVPEPSTYIMLGTGLLLLVGFSRKRFADGNDIA